MRRTGKKAECFKKKMRSDVSKLYISRFFDDILGYRVLTKYFFFRLHPHLISFFYVCMSGLMSLLVHFIISKKIFFHFFRLNI